MSKALVTAATVRSFYRSNEKRFDRLSPEAQVTVREGARGRLHPEVMKDYNRGRKNQYALGNSGAVKAQAKADREALAQAGVAVGKRGPLSAAAKEVLAQSKG